MTVTLQSTTFLIQLVITSSYLTLRRNWSCYSKECVQSSLRAPLSTLHDLLTAVTDTILTGNTQMNHLKTFCCCENHKYKRTTSFLCVPSHSTTGLVALYLNCFSAHINWISPSSSGSFHFRSTAVPSMTSGSKKRLRASLYSQSSGAGCFCNTKQEHITL